MKPFVSKFLLGSSCFALLAALCNLAAAQEVQTLDIESLLTIPVAELDRRIALGDQEASMLRALDYEYGLNGSNVDFEKSRELRGNTALDALKNSFDLQTCLVELGYGHQQHIQMRNWCGNEARFPYYLSLFDAQRRQLAQLLFSPMANNGTFTISEQNSLAKEHFVNFTIENFGKLTHENVVSSLEDEFEIKFSPVTFVKDSPNFEERFVSDKVDGSDYRIHLYHSEWSDHRKPYHFRFQVDNREQNRCLNGLNLYYRLLDKGFDVVWSYEMHGTIQIFLTNGKHEFGIEAFTSPLNGGAFDGLAVACSDLTFTVHE